jgi:putative ABC transport system permease protein
LIEKSKTKNDIQQSLAQIEQKHFTVLTNPDTQQKIRYALQPLMNITPGPFINNPIGPFLPWIFIGLNR